MSEKTETWKLLSLPIKSNLNEGLLIQHHAAQFIALAGNYLIPKQADDSNTNMEYIPSKNMLIGNVLPNGLRLALHLNDLRIGILDKDGISIEEIVLEGKNKQEVFGELKQSLSGLGVDVSSFTNKLHYKMPVHELDKGALFSVKNEFAFIENEIYRYNADIVIKEIASRFEHASSVRIWPHHFDTGSYIPLYFNKNGDVSRSIGIGWSIPDGMVNEPYYYLSFWSKNPMDVHNKLMSLKTGEWQLLNWDGAVLKHSEILIVNSGKGQHELVKTFFNSGIDILTNYFKI